VSLGTVGSIRVLGAEVSSEGGAASRTVECPRKEERSREGARFFTASGRCSEFYWGYIVKECFFPCLFVCLLACFFLF